MNYDIHYDYVIFACRHHVTVYPSSFSASFCLFSLYSLFLSLPLSLSHSLTLSLSVSLFLSISLYLYLSLSASTPHRSLTIDYNIEHDHIPACFQSNQWLDVMYCEYVCT